MRGAAAGDGRAHAPARHNEIESTALSAVLDAGGGGVGWSGPGGPHGTTVRTGRRSARHGGPGDVHGARGTRVAVVGGAFTHPVRGAAVCWGRVVRGCRCAHPRLISGAPLGACSGDVVRGPAGGVFVDGRSAAGHGGPGSRDAGFGPWRAVVFRLDGQRRQVGNRSYDAAAPRWRVGNRTCDGGRGILGWNVRSAASRHRAGQIVARAAALPSDDVAFPTPRGVTEISRG
jgi:hypothetical protein